MEAQRGTGTIAALALGTRTGTIRVEDGSRLPFAADSVLGAFEALHIGHRVSFDRDRGAAVRVFREPLRSDSAKKADSGADLRFAGFEQRSDVRSYHFDEMASGGFVRHSVVVDMALMRKHGISLQEAPALCLRKLTGDLKGGTGAAHQLADGDLLAHALSRSASVQRKRAKPPIPGRRGAPPPGLLNPHRIS